ncbi:hypothetical protein [Desulfatitalea alkaliphila]|uniref:Uncharacterized protein n=1 Tax=Desulfatitalea alkaliphila TaxID=2929485 RepID=A0AA41UHX1_9BACT|nr:hypothetical protein [Desulfatitalea alkaliphila]MCJ8500100.1 hypothetical protein [Desulfatitalea alkaliphila]
MAAKTTDPLETLRYPDRVNYANGVLLDENDFRAEQAYFRGRLGRALAYLHGFGTVAGLKVEPLPTESHVLRVTPGLAVDRLGRLIELQAPYCIRAPNWFATQNGDALAESFANSAVNGGPRAVVADLFIGFNTCERGMTPCFGADNADATDAFTADRLRDAATLDLVLRTQPENDKPRQQAPYETLSAGPMDVATALAELRTFKIETAWRESEFWNSASGKINVGNEYTTRQNGTEVLLARLRLPAGEGPMQYDTNGALEIDNHIRVLRLSTDELFWLIQATREA